MAKPKYTLRRVGATASPAQAITLANQVRPFFRGDKGDRGEQGPPGGVVGAGASLDYLQASPATTWTIAHNLGFRPSAAVFTPGGIEMMGTVQHLSSDVLQISFSTPVAGTARLN